MPARQPSRASVVSEQTIVESRWSAPIPPPGALKQYEEILPGAAERIMVMAEQQSAHRMRLEQTVVEGDSRRSWTGIVMGFVISVMAILSGTYLVVNGHDWTGGPIIGISVAALAGVFVHGSRSRRAERENKSRSMRRSSH